MTYTILAEIETTNGTILRLPAVTVLEDDIATAKRELVAPYATPGDTITFTVL